MRYDRRRDGEPVAEPIKYDQPFTYDQPFKYKQFFAPACKTCRYCNKNDDWYKDPEFETLSCRRNAPVIVNGHTEWPRVKETDWCGEYKEGEK